MGMGTVRWGAVALLLVLAACGGDSDDETAANTTATTTGTPATPTVPTVPYGSEDAAAWCSQLADAVRALAEVNDVDLPSVEIVRRVDAVIAVARTGPGLEVPDITTVSQTVTSTSPTTHAWLDAVNQLSNLCETHVG